MKNNLRIITVVLALIVSDFNQAQIKYESLQNVHLKAKKNDTIMKMINLDEFQSEFSSQSFLVKSKNENENLDLTFKLSSPKLFRFSCLIPQTIPLIVYVNPGDTITYKIDEKNAIVFEGNNASHYNFFKKLNDLELRYPIYNKDGIWEYKKNTTLTYEKKMLFFEEYIKNEKVSEFFEKKIRDVLKFEYLNWLLNRFIIPDDAINDYPKYLKGIDIKKFKRIDQMDNAYFHLALTNYLHLITKINNKFESYSSGMLNYQLDYINKNLTGVVKEYAITKTLSEYDNHLKTEYLNLLQKKVNINIPLIKEKKYKDVLEKIKQKLIDQNSILSEEVLNSKLMDIEGNIIYLKDILKKYDEKIKVFDFWASWCSPCIQEIKKSHEFRDKIIFENNVEFLYFSIDKNFENWKKKVLDLGKFGMNKNQYLIVGNTNSDIGSYFKINTIPQYVILDSTNNIFSINAPSPSDNLQFEKLIKQTSNIK